MLTIDDALASRRRALDLEAEMGEDAVPSSWLPVVTSDPGDLCADTSAHGAAPLHIYDTETIDEHYEPQFASLQTSSRRSLAHSKTDWRAPTHSTLMLPGYGAKASSCRRDRRLVVW